MTFEDWLKRRRVEAVITFLLSITIYIRCASGAVRPQETLLSYKLELTAQVLYQLTDIPIYVYPIEKATGFLIGTDIPKYLKAMSYRELCLLLEKVEERLPGIPEEFVIDM